MSVFRYGIKLLRWSGLILLSGIILLLTFSYRGDLEVAAVEKKYWTSESHFIEMDGYKLHVRIKGEGEPIILLHGSFSSLHTWEAWQQALSPYYLTISLDFPGHGLTGPDKFGRYTTQDYASLVLDLAKKLNLKKFHLAGNSMGGGVAMQVASNEPEKVLTLNLIDAAGVPSLGSLKVNSQPSKARDGGAWIFKLASNPIFSKLFLKCTPKFLFEMNMKQVYGDPAKVTDQLVRRYYELMLREGNREASLDRLRMKKSIQVDFNELTMPTLILWGQKDTWIPVSQGYELESIIQGSNLIVFEQAGHVPMEEIASQSVAEYLSFLGIEQRKDYFQRPKTMTYEK